MTAFIRPELPMIDESVFYELLSGAGTVHVDIACIEEHFVPFVSFAADAECGRVAYGAIVRRKNGLLAADSMDDLLDELHHMAGTSGRLRINYPGEAGYFPATSDSCH